MTDLNKEKLRRYAEQTLQDGPGGNGDPVPAVVIDAAAILSLLDDLDTQAQQFRDWQVSHHANYCSVSEERDQLRAEVEALRNQLQSLIHVSNATGWEEHACGEIQKARALLAKEGSANG